MLVALAVLLAASSCKRRETAQNAEGRSAPSARSGAAITQGAERPSEVIAVFLPDKTVDLAGVLSGPILTLRAQLGDVVEEGAVLAVIDKRKTLAEQIEQEAAVRAAQADCEAKQTEQEFAETQHQMNVETQAFGGVSKLEVARTEQEAKRTVARTKQCLHELEQRRARLAVIRTELSLAEVRAPFHGRVAALYVSVGATVQTAQPILRLVGAGPALVRMAVPPSFVLQTGQSVCLADGQKRWPVQILRVAPEVDEAMGLRVVEARLQGALPVIGESVRVEVLPSCIKETRS